ncbi:hypothetical protein [Streptomyces dioscori]|nr:hypothetical protein [Streptomyces dioscori]
MLPLAALLGEPGRPRRHARSPTRTATGPQLAEAVGYQSASPWTSGAFEVERCTLRNL